MRIQTITPQCDATSCDPHRACSGGDELLLGLKRGGRDSALRDSWALGGGEELGGKGKFMVHFLSILPVVACVTDLLLTTNNLHGRTRRRRGKHQGRGEGTKDAAARRARPTHAGTG